MLSQGGRAAIEQLCGLELEDRHDRLVLREVELPELLPRLGVRGLDRRRLDELLPGGGRIAAGRVDLRKLP